MRLEFILTSLFIISTVPSCIVCQNWVAQQLIPKGYNRSFTPIYPGTGSILF